MQTYTMMFSEDNGKTWEVVCNFNPFDIKAVTEAYEEVDKRAGLLMVVNLKPIFSRPTAAAVPRASDDCHTYS